MKIKNIHLLALVAMMTLAFGSCNNKKFNVSGNISDAKDSTLYFEHMSLNGPVAIDSVKLGDDGAFHFDGKSPEAPEFYRLRIAGQVVNIAVDSTENITVKAAYPTMAYQYEVVGSDDCKRIKELAVRQMYLQGRINALLQNSTLGLEAVQDSTAKLLEQYKAGVKADYIYKEPMKASSYFALFQTFLFGNMGALIFNPRSSEEDVKAFAAVATSWDTYYPNAERGLNLHNIAIEGMKNIRIVKAEQSQKLDPSKVSYAGIIDISLPDSKGTVRRLSELKGQVVLLDFHVFAQDGSTERIMGLRDLYNKYHARGLEIYQVSLDSDEHFWKTKTEALPWVCVRDENGLESQPAAQYNVQSVPTFFLIDRNSTLDKRDVQIKDLDAEIQSLL